MKREDFFTVMDCMSEQDIADIMKLRRARYTAAGKTETAPAEPSEHTVPRIRSRRTAVLAAAAVLACTGLVCAGLLRGAVRKHPQDDVFMHHADYSYQTEPDSVTDDSYPESEWFRGSSGGIKNSPATYVYDGSPITVTYLYSAEGSPEIGFMVFCDGQPVPYHTPDEPDDRLIHTAPVRVPNQEEEIDLILTPAGKKGSTVTLQVCDIVDPMYDLNKLQADNRFLPMIRGLKGWLFYGWPAQVIMEEDGVSPAADYSTNYTRRAVPVSPASTEEEQKSTILRAECTVAGKGDCVYYALQGDDPLVMHLTVYGGSAPEVTVQFLMNWEPAPVFDGKTSLRVPVSEDQYTEFDIVLDPSQFEPGRYLCTPVITPTENLMLQPQIPFVAEISN